MKTFARATSALAFTFLASFAAACGGDDNNNTPDAGPDVDAPPPCVMNPQSHTDLLNACTSADVEKIDKKPVLPLMQADGTLPPIP